MKKLTAILLVFLTMLSLPACSFASGNYKRGLSAMEAFDYETAKSCFESSDYEDSNDLYLECSFLLDIEQAVIRRCERANSSADAANVETFIKEEISKLERYEDKLRTGDIQELFDAYYKGLADQLSYCRSVTLDNEMKFFHGMQARYDVVNTLYDSYGLFSDSDEVYDAYIGGREDQEQFMEKMKAAISSVSLWRSSIGPLQLEASGVKLPDYTNDTDDAFSLQIAITPYDDKGLEYDTDYKTFENIKPGDTITLELSLNCENPAACDLEFDVLE